jgi:hypothetical protein
MGAGIILHHQLNPKEQRKTKLDTKCHKYTSLYSLKFMRVKASSHVHGLNGKRVSQRHGDGAGDLGSVESSTNHGGVGEGRVLHLDSRGNSNLSGAGSLTLQKEKVISNPN